MSHCNAIKPLLYSLLSSVLFTTTAAQASDAKVPRNPLRQAYYGETHMHTAYSLDAFGGTRQTPDDAYRAAKGEAVIVNGQATASAFFRRRRHH
jgi:hypothetical protein